VIGNIGVFYEGTPRGHVQVVDANERGTIVEPLRHVRKHSPDGFAWGYEGSGPAELARCLLIDAFGVTVDDYGDAPIVDRAYQDFKREVVAGWDIDEPWSITRDEVRHWFRAWMHEHGAVT
jgi:hypothetical protein